MGLLVEADGRIVDRQALEYEKLSQCGDARAGSYNRRELHSRRAAWEISGKLIPQKRNPNSSEDGDRATAPSVSWFHRACIGGNRPHRARGRRELIRPRRRRSRN